MEDARYYAALKLTYLRAEKELGDEPHTWIHLHEAYNTLEPQLRPQDQSMASIYNDICEVHQKLPAKPILKSTTFISIYIYE